MSDPDPLATLARISRVLDRRGTRYALVGGLAVSVRGEVRFTRDVDLAVDERSDRDVESLVQDLRAEHYIPRAIVEQDATGRIATVRLAAAGEATVDLLAASSGIEAEVVATASRVDLPAAGSIPVARAEELVALKILAASPRRPQDAIDLEGLLRVNTDLDLARVRSLLELIRARGSDRGEDLEGKLEAAIAASRVE